MNVCVITTITVYVAGTMVLHKANAESQLLGCVV